MAGVLCKQLKILSPSFEHFSIALEEIVDIAGIADKVEQLLSEFGPDLSKLMYLSTANMVGRHNGLAAKLGKNRNRYPDSTFKYLQYIIH